MRSYLLSAILSAASLLVASGVAPAEEGQTIPTTAEGYAISPTGEQLAVVRTSSPAQVELWDLSSLGKQHVLACDASDAVSRVLYSADGATLAARTTAQKLLLWNTLSGERLAALTVPDEQGPVSKFWLSPDGRTVAVVGKDSGSVSLWDREGANCVTTIRGTGQPTRLCCFSIDSRVCTVVFADEVWQWERTEAKGQCRIPKTTGFSVRTAVASAQGEFVAAVTEQGIEIWRTADLKRQTPLEYALSVTPMFTPDGLTLLCVKEVGADSAIDLWTLRLDGGAPEFRYTVSDLVSHTLEVSTDNKTVAFPCVDGSILKLAGLAVETSRTLGKVGQFGDKQTQLIKALALSADGKTIVTAMGSVIRVWDAATGDVSGQLARDTAVERLWLCGDRPTLVSLDAAQCLTLGYLETGLKPVPHRTFDYTTDAGYALGFAALDFTPDGRLLAVALKNSSKVVLLDTIAGKELGTLKFAPILMGFNRAATKLLMLSPYGSVVYDLQLCAMSEVKDSQTPDFPRPEERLVVGRGNDAQRQTNVAFWDPNTGALVRLMAPSGVGVSGEEAISPDGKKYAILSVQAKRDAYGVEIMDIATGRTISLMPLDIRFGYAIGFSPDSTRVLIATPDTVEIVDYLNKTVVRRLDFRPPPETPPQGNESGSRAGAVPMGRNQQGIYLGSLATPKVVCGMDVSRNGIVATASPAGEVKLWDYETGNLLQTITNRLSGGRDGIQLLTFSDDGSRLAYVEDKSVHLLDLSQFVGKPALPQAAKPLDVTGLERTSPAKPSASIQGRTLKGYLGVVAADITGKEAVALRVRARTGVVVTKVLPDSPAQLAGVKAGDIITHIAEQPVTSQQGVVDVVGSLPVDSEQEIKILRDGQRQSVTVTIKPRPADPGRD